MIKCVRTACLFNSLSTLRRMLRAMVFEDNNITCLQGGQYLERWSWYYVHIPSLLSVVFIVDAG